MNDPLYCNWHIRYKCYQKKSDRFKRGEYRPNERAKKMPKFYRTAVTKALGDLMDEHLGNPASEQTSLLEELSLARIVIADAVKMYEACGQIKEKDKRDAAVILAAENLKVQLAFVRDMAVAANKILTEGKDKLTYDNLRVVRDQMVRCAYEAFGEESAQARDFVDKINAAVQVPVGLENGKDGTLLTPDQDVMDMDDTVPGVPN